MRRVIILLLALILVPSIAVATLFQCGVDGKMRTACCCSDGQLAHKDPAPQPASVQDPGCCTVIPAPNVEPSVRAHHATSSDDVVPPMLVVELPGAPACPPPGARAPIVDRLRALGDPPDTLFARRCSLLL